MSRLPWWLNPWGRVRTLEATVRHTDGLLANCHERIAELKSAKAGLGERYARLDGVRASLVRDKALLRNRNEELTRRNAELERQITVLTVPAGSDRALIGYEQAGGAKPEFVIAGIDRGGAGGKRIYVSRDLGAPSFGMEPYDHQPTMKLIVFMAKMLTIDKASYGEALEHMATIWRNADAEAARNTRTGPAAGPPQIRTVQRELPAGDDDGHRAW